MLSSKSIQSPEDADFRYIIEPRIAKTPHEIAEYAKEPGAGLTDGQTFDPIQAMSTGKKTARISRWAVCQCRRGCAALGLRNIGRLVDKAQKMVEGRVGFKRDCFLAVEGAQRSVNASLVAESRLKAGIKGCVTDQDIPAGEIIDAYHQPFEVGRSFRMVKPDPPGQLGL